MAVAQDVFGVPSLYPWQRLVIANIMECEERHLANQVQSQPILDVPKDILATESGDQEDDIINRGRQVVARILASRC